MDLETWTTRSLAPLFAVAIGLSFWLGCSSDVSRPTPSDIGLETLLEHYDGLYDPGGKMLRVDFDNPGYHSRVASGTLVHPTRESLVYALALLRRGEVGDAAQAAGIVRTVLALQDTDADSPTCGVWPWLAEEPLAEMQSPDLNWADFCGAQLAQMLADHGDALPGDLQRAMRGSLRLAAEAIRRRDVGPGYTNIAVLGGAVCAAAGELLEDAELLVYGRRRLKRVVEHTARHGGFNEYNSPPYTCVVLVECERALHVVRDPAAREAAESLRRTAWRTIAESFHAPTQQWAGPHSRTSRDRLRASTAALLSRRTGLTIRPHPAMLAADKPRGHAVVPALPCPAESSQQMLQPPREPRQLRRTFIRGRTEETSTIGTTWLAGDACLGSVSRSSFWTQRKPLIGYWRSEQDPAVVFRMRFSHDGEDFASMAVRTAQQGPRVLAVVHSLAGRGDWHRTLDRPDDGRFDATDLRLRFELRGAGVRAEELGDGRFALVAGDRRVVVHTVASRFAGEEVRWQLGSVMDGDEDYVHIDGVCYEGEARTFDFSMPVEMTLAAGIELLGGDETVSTARPTIDSMGGATAAAWAPGGESLSVTAGR